MGQQTVAGYVWSCKSRPFTTALEEDLVKHSETIQSYGKLVEFVHQMLRYVKFHSRNLFNLKLDDVSICFVC